MFMQRNFRSCYVVDVQTSPDQTILTDSSRNRYYVNMSSSELKDQFKTWFKNVFLKGVSQRLTVFEYCQSGNHPDIQIDIVKFITLGD